MHLIKSDDHKLTSCNRIQKSSSNTHQLRHPFQKWTFPAVENEEIVAKCSTDISTGGCLQSLGCYQQGAPILSVLTVLEYEAVPSATLSSVHSDKSVKPFQLEKKYLHMPDTVVKFVGKASIMQEINLKETSLAAPTALYSNCQSILTGQVLHMDSNTELV